ncbi:MAG: BlaI/MecI/CopY family transcriptional regulator [Hyphomonadaceae bacterium]
MLDRLPRREREIFEIICRLGEASAAQIRDEISDAPSYSAVRTLLARLEAKGHIRHTERDQRYFYSSAERPNRMREKALRNLVDTFFSGSGVDAATALLGVTRNPKPEDLDALQKAVDEARRRK